MKLYGTIAIHVSGEQILRRPGWLDRIRGAFGGEPDLRTGRMRASLEATAIVDAVREALAPLHITDAVSLVIDDLVIFQDRDRNKDDLGDLFLAFHDHSAAIGGGFGVLRLAVEHSDAGVHHVIEIQARTEHAQDEPAVRVIVSGRIEAFTARAGEDAAAYRARVEPLLADRATVELARVAFESFVVTVRDAISRAMPDARAEIVEAQLRLQDPGERRGDRDRRQAQPDDPDYDPHAAYYPNPMANVLGMMAWGSLGMMMMMPGASAMGAGDAGDAGRADDAGEDPSDGGMDWFGGDS